MAGSIFNINSIKPLIDPTMSHLLSRDPTKTPVNSQLRQTDLQQQMLSSHYDNLSSTVNTPMFQGSQYGQTLQQYPQNPMGMLNTYSMNSYLPNQGQGIASPEQAQLMFNQTVNNQLSGYQPNQISSLTNITNAEEIYSKGIQFIAMINELMAILEYNYSSIKGQTEGAVKINPAMQKLKQLQLMLRSKRGYSSSSNNRNMNLPKYNQYYLDNLKSKITSILSQFEIELEQYANLLTTFNRAINNYSNQGMSSSQLVNPQMGLSQGLSMNPQRLSTNPLGMNRQLVNPKMVGGFQSSPGLYRATRQLFDLFRILFTIIYSTLINDIMVLQNYLLKSNPTEASKLISSNMKELPKVIESIVESLDSRLIELQGFNM